MLSPQEEVGRGVCRETMQSRVRRSIGALEIAYFRPVVSLHWVTKTVLDYEHTHTKKSISSMNVKVSIVTRYTLACGRSWHGWS